MPTVAFDFDSTLIDRESLDEILARALLERPLDAERIRAITVEGMEGRIPFRESMERRLAIAKPRRRDVEGFGEEATRYLTPGLADLIRTLDADVWIVSGALVETLWPVADLLGVPHRRVLGTRARWSRGGELLSLVRCGTKEEAVRASPDPWTSPRVGVGDGMSDYALLEAGLLDHFIAFTAHVARAPLLATGVPNADSVERLRYLLAGLL